MLTVDLHDHEFKLKIIVQISHQCMMTELQRFPVLQKRMDEVIGNFLREGLEPSQAMIRDLIEMEVRMNNLGSTQS